MSKWNPVDAFRQYMDGLMAGEVDRLLVTDDMVIIMPGLGESQGVKTSDETQAVIGAFSNVEVTVNNAVAEGNKCAVEFCEEMDHTGPLQWSNRIIQATGKHLKLETASFVIFDREGEGAKIRRVQFYFDPMEMLIQLGVE